jgi:hypothetical protein
VVASEAQERAIEAVVEPPALEIIGAAQELGLTDTASHIVVQVLLEGLLEELHANGQIFFFDMQAIDDGPLVEVVLVPVMGLADEDHALVGELVDQPAEVTQGRHVDHSGSGIDDLVGSGFHDGLGPLIRRGLGISRGGQGQPEGEDGVAGQDGERS